MLNSDDIDRALVELPSIQGYVVRVRQYGYARLRLTPSGDNLDKVGSDTQDAYLAGFTHLNMATIFHDSFVAERCMIRNYLHVETLTHHAGVLVEIVPLYGNPRVMGVDALDIHWKSGRNAILYGVRN